MRPPLPAGARRRGLIAALLACVSIASATQAADAVDPAQLAEARAAYQAAFEHYTRLVTTPGAKGDRAAALAAYREASTRYRALQARLEGAGRSAPGTPAPAAPTRSASSRVVCPQPQPTSNPRSPGRAASARKASRPRGSICRSSCAWWRAQVCPAVAFQ